MMNYYITLKIRMLLSINIYDYEVVQIPERIQKIPSRTTEMGSKYDILIPRPSIVPLPIKKSGRLARLRAATAVRSDDVLTFDAVDFQHEVRTVRARGRLEASRCLPVEDVTGDGERRLDGQRVGVRAA